MLTFCPLCSNLLMIQSTTEDNVNKFQCSTCPYSFPIVGFQIFDRKTLNTKVVDDILGGEGAWDNVDQTQAQCPVNSCSGNKAYYFQLQIRSADENSTTFLKCTTCSHRWRED
ncbi:uncharacterized protein LODBEIA_P38480 [Lodderomyces beijingensis]|uniref:DNA-directed RNA polymerase subunit n=1 Tax=Lodderomyces beijingensis TaxID=1775926 RepID=A0ABP0ZNB8_9ASCO